MTYPLNPSGFVYIFGGGHVGRALVETLKRIDFECIIFDDRARYADPAEHPLAVRTIHGDYTDISKDVRFTEADYIIIVTHGHHFDYEVLAQTLDSPAKYVGCMGSRRKTAIIKERLKNEAGVSEANIDRLHSPIGFKIGAETPEELAISIAAQLIEFRAKG
ncbi:MAG: XdhC/CoxF family protein [Clostridiales bacterium]|nr:XdhC/CoxF family protein [Clostridiales bacterium]